MTKLANAAKETNRDESAERSQLDQAEAVIQDGMSAYRTVGAALRSIKTDKLYRTAGFSSFADYCKQRWGLSKAYAYNVIGAATVADRIEKAGLPVPMNEAQCRKLKKADDQTSVWRTMLDHYDRQPTADDIDSYLTYRPMPTDDESSSVEDVPAVLPMQAGTAPVDMDPMQDDPPVVEDSDDHPVVEDADDQPDPTVEDESCKRFVVTVDGSADAAQLVEVLKAIAGVVDVEIVES